MMGPTSTMQGTLRQASMIACLSLAAANAPAQNATPAGSTPAVDDDDVVELPAFTVSEESADRYRAGDAISAVRVRADLIDTPSSISVLTRDFIDDVSPSRVFDAVRYVAGVQEGRGIQFQDRMIIRGFETQNGARTVDNFLQPSDADNIEESVIERVEVTKGPNAILSPSGAPGGSLNIITKSPLFRKHGSFTVQLGLYDAQKATLDMGGPFSEDGKYAYRLVGSYQNSRRYWSEDAKIKGSALAPMFAWKISDRTLFTVKVVAAEHWIFREPLLILDPSTTASTSKPKLAPNIDPSGLNGIQPWSHVGTHSADMFATLTTSLNEKVSLRFAANGRYYFEDSEQNFLSTPSFNNRYNPATGELTQDYTWSIVNGTPVSTFSPYFDPTSIPNRGDDQATRRKTFNFQSDAVIKHRFGAMSSQTVAGFGYSNQDAYGRGYNGVMPAINLANPDYNVRPVYGANYSFYNESTYENIQLYVNERLGLMDDRLQLTGGILHYDTKTTGRNVLTNGAPSVLDDAKDMWLGSVLFKVKENVSLYYSHSTNASPVIANNQPLWREGVQDEVGFKSEFFERRLAFNAAWFKVDQTNVTVPNPAYQIDPANEPQTLVSDLGNDGFELELQGRLTDNLSAFASYSHLKMRDNLGRQVRGVADDLASLMLNYSFTEGSLDGLALNFGVTYTGRRAGDVPINFTAAPFSVPGLVSFNLEPSYTTMLGATYRLNERYLFRLNVDNVFDDADYIAVAGGRVAGTGITTQPGINVRLSMTVDF